MNLKILIDISILIFFIYSYIVIENDLKTNFLSYYLLFTIFFDAYIIIYKYYKFDKPIHKCSFIFIRLLKIFSYPYIIYRFPNPFDSCDIYENYKNSTCLAMQYISMLGISVYFFFSLILCFLSVSFALNKYKSTRIRVLTVELIKNLPVSIIPPDDNICSICLEEAQENDQWKVLNCGHKFHSICIEEWLFKNANCPFCRAPQLVSGV